MYKKIIFSIFTLLSFVIFAQNRRNYAAHSVLKEGDTYKIAILQEGIYRLDAAYFQSIGIEPANINPATIQIFGNGAGVVPQANADFRYDDVYENPIFVSSQGNTFGQNDYVLFYGASPHSWTFNPTNQQFSHQQNVYSDSNFYFLKAKDGTTYRLQNFGTNSAEDIYKLKKERLI